MWKHLLCFYFLLHSLNSLLTNGNKFILHLEKKIIPVIHWCPNFLGCRPNEWCTASEQARFCEWHQSMGPIQHTGMTRPTFSSPALAGSGTWGDIIWLHGLEIRWWSGGGSINCHCSPATSFPYLWVASEMPWPYGLEVEHHCYDQ